MTKPGGETISDQPSQAILSRMQEVAQELFEAAATATPEEVDGAVGGVVLEGLREELGVDENDPRGVNELMEEVKRRS